MAEDSFWVAIPYEALLVIGEQHPAISEYLGWVAIVGIDAHCDPPPKQWAARVYAEREQAYRERKRG